MAATKSRTLLGENQLVDDDVVRVNLVLRELLNQSLCFVERQEFRDANADESGLVLSSRGGSANGSQRCMQGG